LWVRLPFLGSSWHNRVFFDPNGHEDHVESFFFKANDPHAPRALWVRLTLYGSAQARFAETWAIYFDADLGVHHAAKERFSIKDLFIDPKRQRLRIGDCLADEAYTEGHVARGEHVSLSWRLALTDEHGPYRHFPSDILYSRRFDSMKLVSPHPCASARGELELKVGAEQQTISLDGWRAMQGHNWGPRHTERYAWCHCNAFTPQPGEAEIYHGKAARATAGSGHGVGTFFEAFQAETTVAKVKGVVRLGRFVLAGRTYRFDYWYNLMRGSGRITPTSWHFAFDGPAGRLHGNVVSEAARTVGLVYDNPTGPPSQCLNSKLARLELVLEPKNSPALRFVSDRAALEVGQYATDHGIGVVL
jgi:hypothetical protein